MKIAVLADIHGVLPALDAVLAEPDVVAAERIVLAGDIAAGPQPVAVLDRSLGLGDRVVWVRGNADRELVAFARGESIPTPDRITPWAAEQLRAEHLAGLPHPVVLGDVLVCHGTPRADDEAALVDTSLERWTEVLADVPDHVQTMVCGHTHMPFVRLVGSRQVVNPGSVGMPYGRPGAHWALLDGESIALRRTRFDVTKAIDDIRRDSAFPQASAWAEHFLTAKASDADAMAVFR